VIRAVDGIPIYAFRQLRDTVAAAEGTPLTLSIWRAGEPIEVTLVPKLTDLPGPGGRFETSWKIGVTGGISFVPALERVTFFDALTHGVSTTFLVLRTSINSLFAIIRGDISTCNLQGPVGIAENSGAAATQGVEHFIRWVALLSAAVGLMNLFPIPVLDGGHLVLHAYEAVSGKPPSDKAMRLLIAVGLTLLLSLMLFALTNDIFCP